VVVDDDAVAGGDPGHAGARLQHLADDLVAKTAGSLRATYASLTSEPQTPQASTRQTTSPEPATGSGALFDDHVAWGRGTRG
jgi:hypothetical protein